MGALTEAQQRDNERVLERVQRLHHPVELWLPYPEADFSFESHEAAVEYGTSDLPTDDAEADDVRAQVASEIASFKVCAECKGIEREQAADRGYEHAAWPCRTAQTWGAT